MTICLNPNCSHPENPDRHKFCQACGNRLLLGEKYRPLKRIGCGNFSRTFVGVVEENPAKPRCIIKQFRHQSKKAAESFEVELKNLSELGQHPQIPALLDWFDRDRRQYLVQEFIDGPNLAEELAQTGSQCDRSIQELLESLLPVLHWIHHYGLIHRDIKPENIIRRRSNGDWVLVDFGVAKQATATAMLDPGTMVGSAEFTAPEQLMGQAVFASDLYSLGLTCIHLLTDMNPFDLFDSVEGVWVWQDYLGTSVRSSLKSILDRMVLPVNQRYDSAKAVLNDLKPSAIARLTGPMPTVRKASPKRVEKSATKSKDRSQNLSKKSQKTTKNVMTAAVGSSSPLPRWHCVQTLSDRASGKTLPEISSIAFSAQSRTLIAGSWDGTIDLWDFTNGQLLHRLSAHTDRVVSLTVSPNGQTLASGSADGSVLIWRLWQLGTAELHQGVPPIQKFRLSGHTNVVASLAITADGLTLASGSRDRTIKLWNLQTGEAHQTLTGHKQRVISVAFSPDRQRLASGSEDCTIKLWDANNGREIGELTGHLGAVYAVAIAPDNRQLVSSSWDRTIKIWDLQTHQVLHNLTGHLLPSTTVAIAPNGKTLASGSHDATIKLWDLASGTLQTTLAEHSLAVTSVIFSPDGNTLASGSSDGTVKLWRLSS